MRESVCAEVGSGSAHVRTYGFPSAQVRAVSQVVHHALGSGEASAQSRAGFRHRCRNGAASAGHANRHAANIAVAATADGAVAASKELDMWFLQLSSVMCFSCVLDLICMSFLIVAGAEPSRNLASYSATAATTAAAAGPATSATSNSAVSTTTAAAAAAAAATTTTSASCPASGASGNRERRRSKSRDD